MSQFQPVQRPGSGLGGRVVVAPKAKTSRTDGTGNMRSKTYRKGAGKRRRKGRAGLTIQLDAEKPLPRF